MKKNKVTLIGNYPPDKQQSMLRFHHALLNNLNNQHIEISSWTPPEFLSRWAGMNKSRIFQLVGYIDKFILGLPLLFWHRLKNRASIWHIVDHGNAGYIWVLPRTRTVITVHDCLALDSARKKQAKLSGQLFQRWIHRSLYRARHLCTVSHETARQLTTFSISPECVTTIPNALNHPYKPLHPNEVYQRLKKSAIPYDRPFLFHVGGNSWYKNRTGVIGIFNAFRRRNPNRNWRLVLAGQTWTYDLRIAVNTSEFHCDIHDAGSVDDDTLEACYNACSCFIFPSLAEGFGWPIIEAQACGATVITSNRSPMNEVGGQGAWYADPNDHTAFSLMIETATQHGNKAAARRNARQFNPKTWAASYVKIYQIAASRRV